MTWLFVVWSFGCPKPGFQAFDPDLPEEEARVEAGSPREILEAGAAELEPEIRAAALRLVLGADWGENWDARALGDPSPWVQRQAAQTLLARGPNTTPTLLAFVAQADRDLMVRALVATRRPSREMAQAIAPALASTRSPWERAPLALAAWVNGDDTAGETFLADVETGELPLDVDWLFEVGASSKSEIIPSLRKAQLLVEEELRLPVAAARWMLGDSTAEEPFRKAISGSDVERRLEAMDYLVRMDVDQVRGLLVKARAQGPSLVTWYADLALASATGGSPSVFEKGALDEDAEVRELAVRFVGQAAFSALNRKTSRAAERVIESALSDPDDRVRIAAIRATRTLGLRQLTEAIEPLLVHENGLIRLEAAGTLESLD